MNKTKRIWISIGLVLLTLIGLIGWRYQRKIIHVGEIVVAYGRHFLAKPNPPPILTLPSEEKIVLTVTTLHPIREQWPESLLSSGGIYPWHEAIVSAEQGGLAIIDLGVDVGSRVQKGQELARLSDVTLQANLAQQRANVAKAKAALAEAAANATRARTLRPSGALSEQQVTQNLWGEDSAKASLALAEAALLSEEIHLRQTRILAVDDGVISSRTATLGAVVQVGSELFRLVRQERLEWRAEFTAAQLSLVKIGQTAHIRLSNGSQIIEGKVRQLAPTLDPISRKGLAYIDLPRVSPARSGMFAQGEILLGTSPVVSLPQKALVLRDGNAYFFEVIGTDRVRQHKVKIGRRAEDRVEIIGGLADTTKIVAAGGAFLNEGDRVLVTEAPHSTVTH